MKKIVALMGSPRKGKNTDIILNSLLKGINKKDYSVHKIYLAEKNLKCCTACDSCKRDGQCILEDDMREIYDLFDEGDVFILASPLYFNSVSSLTKIVIDRCQRYWSLKCSLNKIYRKYKKRIGIFLSVGGADFEHDQFQACIKTIDLFFKSIDVKYVGNYLVSGTDKKAIWNRKDLLEEVQDIGRNIEKTSCFYIHR